MNDIAIAVIGGSGVYRIEDGKIIEEKNIDTPFGTPSDTITIAQINDRKVAFLPRHGKGHRLLPSEVPSKANIYALKSLGVRKIISISAVGSLKEEIRPTDIVLPSQIIDQTKGRDSTFFGNGLVGHVAFSEPFCPVLREDLKKVISTDLTENATDKKLFDDEIYICMEGPQFSTRAESRLHKRMGAGVIGMTAVPEAKLAREAEICYATIALPTDYDSWRENEADVDVTMVLENMKENNATVKRLLPKIIAGISLNKQCNCENAARFAIMTDTNIIPRETREKLGLFYSKYWKKKDKQ